MKYIIVLNLILLTSCSLFQTKSLNRSITKASKSVCLSSEGKGRLEVLKRKYVFSYESALDQEAANWMLALSFPLRDQESFTLDWSEQKKIKFTSSIEDKILKENRNINPGALHEFTQSLGSLIHEIILSRNKPVKGSQFIWTVSNKDLIAQSRNKKFKASFLNLNAAGYFGLMRIKYKNEDTQSYNLDLVVRNCHEM